MGGLETDNLLSSDQDVCESGDQAPFSANFYQYENIQGFTVDDQESRPSQRCNQAIKVLFSRSNVLIPVACVSTDGIEVITPCCWPWENYPVTYYVSQVCGAQIDNELLTRHTVVNRQSHRVFPPLASPLALHINKRVAKSSL